LIQFKKDGVEEHECGRREGEDEESVREGGERACARLFRQDEPTVHDSHSHIRIRIRIVALSRRSEPFCLLVVKDAKSVSQNLKVVSGTHTCSEHATKLRNSRKSRK
jgi:hypothetical protein